MAHDLVARETVIELLKAAGFAERVPPRRRDRDPEPASGFTAYTETDGSVLVCWVTSAGGYCASYHEVAESLKMAEAYAGACRAAGWTATLGGISWHHARLTPPGGPLHFPSRPLPGPVQGCGGLLCSVCARPWGLAAVHFSPDGICAFGHQLEEAPRG